MIWKAVKIPEEAERLTVKMTCPTEHHQGNSGHVMDEHFPKILKTISVNAYFKIFFITFLFTSTNCEKKRDQ